MGRRGPKPTPRAILQLRGSKHEKYDRPDEVRMPSAIPNPPSWLDREASQEWKRVVPVFGSLGLLSKVDRAALAMLCCNWSLFYRLSKALDKMINNGQFDVEFQRASSAMNSAAAAHSRAAAAFGLSPSSRASLRPGSSVPPRQTNDGATELFGF